MTELKTIADGLLRPPPNKDQEGGHHEKTFFHSVTMLGLFLTLAVASVHAQSRTKIEVTIPVDFTVGNTDLKAGKYSVGFISHNALLLRSADAKKSVIIVAPKAIGGNKNKPERLVFHRYGGHHFLAQVWMLRTDSGASVSSILPTPSVVWPRNIPWPRAMPTRRRLKSL